MNVALVSCESLPGWEVDDQPLIDELENLGASVHRPAWTEELDWGQFDIAVIRTTWDYHSRKDDFLAWCETIPNLHNHVDVVRWNTHKSYLRDLEKLGVPIAPTVWIQKNEKTDITQIMNTLQASKGFIKPQVGACASDTLRFDINDLVSARTFLESNRHQDMMVQPYLESVETEGEYSAIFIDHQFTHGVQKIPVEGDYRVQDDFGAEDLPYTFTTEEIAEMKQALQFVPMSDELLYARFDYLRDENNKLVLNELELVEPSLFFRHCKEASNVFAKAIVNRAKMSKC